MTQTLKPFVAVFLLLLLIPPMGGCRKNAWREPGKQTITVVTSDTILSGMCKSLLPSNSFAVTAILPHAQCPGHYDVKPSDLEKVRRADLVVFFAGMPFMKQTEIPAGKALSIDSQGHNWMAPNFYLDGLEILAGELSQRFPEHKFEIEAARDRTILKAREAIHNLRLKMEHAGMAPIPVIASSMLREPLEWMGCRVVGEYGRPESISAKEIAMLIRTGRETQACLVIDNLQSGPDTGKGIAETLGVPHVVFSNFPSESGYVATLGENINSLLVAVKITRCVLH